MTSGRSCEPSGALSPKCMSGLSRWGMIEMDWQTRHSSNPRHEDRLHPALPIGNLHKRMYCAATLQDVGKVMIIKSYILCLNALKELLNIKWFVMLYNVCCHSVLIWSSPGGNVAAQTTKLMFVWRNISLCRNLEVI